ncbi:MULTISPECIES: thioesterase family protein [Caproicibacterium]|uniref:Thioesterase family protein n=1 Tax=Caproicibacterium argilliputei TaxID=3030016 RepID=A0AA97DAT8_9FIRM|nr:thioesterase family protein [Caproicibacterium argilliputei]WOC32198.1 thioesterase family protein [Caproicibacterium argilliputei]
MAETVVLTQEVTEEMLAVNVGSGSLRVLATPVVCAWFEKAAAQLAQRLLPEGQTTVGCAISVEHTAPTPLGMDVTVTAQLTAHEGRGFTFTLRAEDEAGVCATGTHRRVAVGSERFQQKADAKKAK